MSILPRNTILGDLRIFEVFHFYDVPRLFGCRSTTEQIYFACWIDEVPDADTWLYLPVSETRYNFIRSGGIDLYDAFKLAEGVAFKVVTPFEAHADSQIEALAPDCLDDEWLPFPGERLEAETTTLAATNVTAQADRARAMRRNVLSLALDFPMLRSEAPARVLGPFIERAQELLDAIGQVKAGTPQTTGRIPSKILDQTEMLVFGASASSFAIEMLSQQAVDLVEYSLAADSIEELTALLHDAEKAEATRSRLRVLQGRVASKYRSLLSHLAGADSGLKLNWASPLPNRGGTVNLSAYTVKFAAKLVSEVEEELAEEVVVEGRMVAAHTKRLTFTLASDDGETYSGKASHKAMPLGYQLVLNQRYRCTIKVLREVSSTGEERVRNELVHLEALP